MRITTLLAGAGALALVTVTTASAASFLPIATRAASAPLPAMADGCTPTDSSSSSDDSEADTSYEYFGPYPPGGHVSTVAPLPGQTATILLSGFEVDGTVTFTLIGDPNVDVTLAAADDQAMRFPAMATKVKDVTFTSPGTQTVQVKKGDTIAVHSTVKGTLTTIFTPQVASLKGAPAVGQLASANIRSASPLKRLVNALVAARAPDDCSTDGGDSTDGGFDAGDAAIVGAGGGSLGLAVNELTKGDKKSTTSGQN